MGNHVKLVNTRLQVSCFQYNYPHEVRILNESVRTVLNDILELQPLLLNRSMGISQNEQFSPVQYYVLFTLRCHGEMTPAECCRRTQISKQQLSKLLDGPTCRNVIERRPNPLNRRSILISVSEEGKQKLDEFKEKQMMQLMPAFSQLQSEDLEMLHHHFSEVIPLLKKLQSKEN